MATQMVQLFTGFAEDMPAGTVSGPGWVPWNDEHLHVFVQQSTLQLSRLMKLTAETV